MTICWGMERFLGSGEPCPEGQEKGGRRQTWGSGSERVCRAAVKRITELPKWVGVPEDLGARNPEVHRWNGWRSVSAVAGRESPDPGKATGTDTCIGAQRLRLPVTFVRGNGWEKRLEEGIQG
jgi:hypothetical protein